MARRSAQVQQIVDSVKTEMLSLTADIAKRVESIEQKAEAAKTIAEDFSKKAEAAKTIAEDFSKKAEVAVDSATTIANSLKKSQPKCEYKLSKPMKSDSEVLLSALKNQAMSSSTTPSTGFKDAVKSFLDNWGGVEIKKAFDCYTTSCSTTVVKDTVKTAVSGKTSAKDAAAAAADKIATLSGFTDFAAAQAKLDNTSPNDSNTTKADAEVAIYIGNALKLSILNLQAPTGTLATDITNLLDNWGGVEIFPWNVGAYKTAADVLSGIKTAVSGKTTAKDAADAAANKIATLNGFTDFADAQAKLKTAADDANSAKHNAEVAIYIGNALKLSILNLQVPTTVLATDITNLLDNWGGVEIKTFTTPSTTTAANVLSGIKTALNGKTTAKDAADAAADKIAQLSGFSDFTDAQAKLKTAANDLYTTKADAEVAVYIGNALKLSILNLSTTGTLATDITNLLDNWGGVEIKTFTPTSTKTAVDVLSGIKTAVDAVADDANFVKNAAAAALDKIAQLSGFTDFAAVNAAGTTDADKVLQLGSSLKLAILNVKPDPSIAASGTQLSAIEAAEKGLKNFITNLKFSKFQATDVVTSNDCLKEKTCSISSKQLNSVYDGGATPAAFSFASGDYLKFVSSADVLKPIKDAVATAASATGASATSVKTAASTVVTDKIADNKIITALTALDPTNASTDTGVKMKAEIDKIIDAADGYMLRRYDSTDKETSNPVIGKITNINCEYALFEGSNGKKTLLSFQSSINDGGPLSFIGKNNPTIEDITSNARTGSFEPLPSLMPENLYSLKFGDRQLKMNTNDYPVPSGCDAASPATDGCKISGTASNAPLTMLRDGRYIQLSPSDNPELPYTAKLFNKDGKFAGKQDDVKIKNMNSDYIILSKDDNHHGLLSLKNLLSNNTVESFTGVASKDLTLDYIYTTAAGGSRTPLVLDHFLKSKFNTNQAGDVHYEPDCLSGSKCTIKDITVAKLAGDQVPTPVMIDNDYLKFYKNINGSYAIKLENGTSVIKTVSTSGKIVNGNQNHFLFVDDKTSEGILFRWASNFGGKNGDVLRSSDSAKTGLTPQGDFSGTIHPSSDELDSWSSV